VEVPGGGGSKQVTTGECSTRMYLAAAGGLSQKASAVSEETARGTGRSRWSIERLMLTLGADNSSERMISDKDIDLACASAKKFL